MNQDTNLESIILSLNKRLLDAISSSDYEGYASLVDEKITAFEPEAVGHLVEGLDFHKFYFDAFKTSKRVIQQTMIAPQIRILGSSKDAAVISYVRLIQRIDDKGVATTTQSEETRVWEKKDGVWKNVHFHRSVPKAIHPST